MTVSKPDGVGDDVFEMAGAKIEPGEIRDLALAISQSYSGVAVTIPLRVIRGQSPGPTVLVTGAIHGDELNGTGIIRELALDPSFIVDKGVLILVPVMNILGYERKSRYLPDRRDLNRCFPGSARGSMASRIAHHLFHQLVSPSDIIIDLHTAAVGRTNFPNIRADLSLPETRRIARSFGCSLVVDSSGAKGTLRAAAGIAGIPAIVLEAGEVWKVEPAVVETGVRGVKNVLIELGMLEGEPERPAYQARIDKSRWQRSDAGGLLRFHVAPGEVVEKGQPIATCTTLLGAESGTVRASQDGVVMGLTTLPSVKPGDPVCHLAIPRRGIGPIRKAEQGLPDESLHERLLDDLASSVSVDEFDE